MKLLAAAVAVALTIGAARAQDFPVTVEHDFGATTIPAKPQRVVSVGVHEPGGPSIPGSTGAPGRRFWSAACPTP
jgi:ABC-type Fe3+-hydroxamate transport system substrate-binding protein